jgi:hypothetical protein
MDIGSCEALVVPLFGKRSGGFLPVKGWAAPFRVNNSSTCKGSEQRWLASQREVIGVTARFPAAGYKRVVVGAPPA